MPRIALAALLLIAACRKPRPEAVQQELRCGMSVQQATGVARKHGYGHCFVPTHREGTPHHSCTSNGQGVAFWFDRRGLTAWQHWDAEAEECPDRLQESGCASEILPLCR